MNEASRWRMDVAREIAALYATRPGLRMIVAGGSTARGQADAFSDLDLVAYWDTTDVEWLTTAPLHALNGVNGPAERFTYLEVDAHGGRLEQYFFGALKIDVASIAMARWEKMVAGVLDRYDIAPGGQKSLGGFLEATPLFGEAEWRRWSERISRYPEELAVAMVKAHLFYYPVWVPRHMALDRGDLLAFYDLACSMIKNLLGLLAGLNRRYHATAPEPKWTEQFLDSLPIKPPETFARMDAVLRRPDATSLQLLYDLITESLDLVSVHLAEVDTARARQVLEMQLNPVTRHPLGRL